VCVREADRKFLIECAYAIPHNIDYHKAAAVAATTVAAL
jgi:hypothetical protein